MSLSQDAHQNAISSASETTEHTENLKSNIEVGLPTQVRVFVVACVFISDMELTEIVFAEYNSGGRVRAKLAKSRILGA